MSDINIELDPRGPRAIAVGIDDGPGHSSAVSWGAIFAGAAGAAALSLLLLILGIGLGLSAVSPWTMEGLSATTFGVVTIAWLTFTQLAASGMGGYLAGRLRTKWASVHTDEVYFRDTAHGFLSWAVAALLTAAVLTSVAGAIVSGGVRAGAAMAGGAAGAAGSAAMLAGGETGSGETSNSIEYFVDSLFRRGVYGNAENAGPPAALSNNSEGGQNGEEAAEQQADAQQPEPLPATQKVRDLTREVAEIPSAEVIRIFARALRNGTLPEADQRYVGHLIAQRTDLSQQEAEQRVAQGFAEVKTKLEEMETTARETADEARKASAYGALWIFVSLLIGAFVASLMAVFGGRQRDA